MLKKLLHIDMIPRDLLFCRNACPMEGAWSGNGGFLPGPATFHGAVVAEYCRRFPAELEAKYPDLTPKEREYRAAKEYGALFLEEIGGALPISGKPHDGRAPDYDDWSLNGDIIVYYPVLDIALELSSMGIRVDAEALRRQLEISGFTDRAKLPYHRDLLDGKLPLTIGGGIGQSRMCMFFLRKAHIGEVQASCWPAEDVEICKKNGIELL